MDTTEQRDAGAPARPYGYVGLAVSVVLLAPLTMAVFAAIVALLAAATPGVGLGALADAIGLMACRATASQAPGEGAFAACAPGHEAGARLLEAATKFFSAAGSDGAMTALLAASCLFYAAWAGSILLMALWRGGARWRDIVAWRPFSPDLLWVATTLGAVVYGIAAGAVVVWLHPEAKGWFVPPRDAPGLAATFALAVAMAPLAEELMFRGWIFTALRARWSATATILATSLLFATAHWEKTHLYALAVFPAGLLMGFVRERFASVRATIWMHAVYNGSALLAKLLLPD